MRSGRNRRSRVRMRRLSGLSVNRMVPNVLTLLALCAGMTAVRFAMGGNFEAAVFSIIAAGIFDGLDGRMARLLKATSSFGAELDSLSDFVSFGVAPAAVLYLWTLSELHGLGWAIALLFAVCCALRLARFNTEASHEMLSYVAPFFIGAPAPAGAGLVMVPMFLSFEWGDWLFRSPCLSAVTVTVIALLMVSKVPTVSLKRIRIPHHLGGPDIARLWRRDRFPDDGALADPDRRRRRLCQLDPADHPRLLSVEAHRRRSQDRDCSRNRTPSFRAPVLPLSRWVTRTGPPTNGGTEARPPRVQTGR